MKTLGIIGGLGPETTAEFYLEVILGCKKINKLNYPNILINSIPLSFNIEKNAMTKGVDKEKCLPYLLKAAKNLERSGADFLVLPCNSLHIFIDKIRKAVKIPVISILEETADFLESQKIYKVGIIGTSITIKNKLYDKVLQQKNIKINTPNIQNQSKIGKLVHNLVSQKYNKNDRDILIKIIKDLKGVAHVILACTDLQLLLPKVNGIKIHDTMKILADAAVKHITH